MSQNKYQIESDNVKGNSEETSTEYKRMWSDEAFKKSKARYRFFNTNYYYRGMHNNKRK